MPGAQLIVKLFTVLLCSTFCALAAERTISPTVTDFFPNIGGNLTKVTWAHAVNSQAALKEALDSSEIMMLEADIVLGTLNTTDSTDVIPVMGHPPANVSDLSLEEFLNSVLADTKRGVKLDFKTIEVFIASQDILAKVRKNMTFPVWLNADILSGPVNATGTPVNATTFLAEAAETFPESTLSIGWTTRYGTEYEITEGSYSADQVSEMISTVKSNNVTMPITYPVRAGIAANSLAEMQTLISETGNGATLTIWSSSGDEVDGEKLSNLITTIGVDKVYIDVPDEVWNDLNIGSGSSRTTVNITVALVAVLAAFLFTGLF